MSDYKMSQYDLQSYFKSLCNSFYIAYEQVKRLEKEEEGLKAEEQEYGRKFRELSKIRNYWEDNMYQDYEAIKSVLYTMKENGFLIIVTTKAEIYALIKYYSCYKVKYFPIINMDEKYMQAFPTGEELYDDFLSAYKEALDKDCVPDAMDLLEDKYF